jgi:hypothetical protein
VIRRGKFFVVLLAAAFLTAGTAAGEERPKTGANVPKLRMDELEVHGKAEKAPVLYLPVPEGIFFLSSPMLDLIREELARPVLPADVAAESRSQRGLSGGGENP